MNPSKSTIKVYIIDVEARSEISTKCKFTSNRQACIYWSCRCLFIGAFVADKYFLYIIQLFYVYRRLQIHYSEEQEKCNDKWCLMNLNNIIIGNVLESFYYSVSDPCEKKLNISLTFQAGFNVPRAAVNLKIPISKWERRYSRYFNYSIYLRAAIGPPSSYWLRC